MSCLLLWLLLILPCHCGTFEYMQVSVLGPFANSSEMLLGNYYGTPAGPVTTPFEAIQVTPPLLTEQQLATLVWPSLSVKLLCACQTAPYVSLMYC